MKKATIIGGSITGLSTGILLRRIGWDVEIYEKSASRLSDRGAGIVMQSATREILRLCGAEHDDQVAVTMKYRKYLNADDSIQSSRIMPQLMTSWGLLYTWLKRNFPDEHYHQGQDFQGFTSDEEIITARFKSGLEVRSDLLIAADGIRSGTRRLVLPDLRAEYAGYVAWRGVIEESEAPSDILDMFHNSFTFYQTNQSHIFCYLIPDGEGNTSVGHRRLNWVWYWNTTKIELEELLTVRSGETRAYATSPGAVQPELENKQRQLAAEILPPVFRKLVHATKHPFIQAIIDLGSPQLVFGRAILLGDAAFILRPHTAAGTEKGVANAYALVDELMKTHDLSKALARWHRSELTRGQGLMRYGQTLGDNSQSPGNLDNRFLMGL